MRGIIDFSKTRPLYAGWADWLLAGYNRILLRLSSPLPGRRAHCRIRLAGAVKPFWARLGTTDLHVLEEIYFRGEYDSVVLKMPSSPRLIVDLGANVGYSLRYWHQHFPEAEVIAVEPDPENAKLCRKNMEIAGIKGCVKILEMCVGSHERTVHLETKQGEWAFRMVEGLSEKAAGVPVSTIPQILARVPLQTQISLLKCDIEGAEAELFGNCTLWIQRVQNIVIELHHPYSETALLEDIKKGGASFKVLSHSKSESNPVLFLTNQSELEPKNHA